MHTDIKLMRRRLGLSQKGFADRFRVSQATVSRLETGHRTLKGPLELAVEQLAAELEGQDETGSAA